MSDALLPRRHPQAGSRPAGELADRLREANAVTPDLFGDVIGETCWRLPSLRRTKQVDRLEQLIRSGAWTDAALALLELELPQWRLRRIAYDAGEWLCALSRQRELPDWLDQSIESGHADLSLAILSALVEASRLRTSPAGSNVPGVRPADDTLDAPLCCDNFT